MTSSLSAPATGSSAAFSAAISPSSEFGLLSGDAGEDLLLRTLCLRS